MPFDEITSLLAPSRRFATDSNSRRCHRNSWARDESSVWAASSQCGGSVHSSPWQSQVMYFHFFVGRSGSTRELRYEAERSGKYPGRIQTDQHANARPSNLRTLTNASGPKSFVGLMSIANTRFERSLRRASHHAYWPFATSDGFQPQRFQSHRSTLHRFCGRSSDPSSK